MTAQSTAHLDAALAGDVLDRLARQPRAVLLVVHSPEALDERWRVVDRVWEPDGSDIRSPTE